MGNGIPFEELSSAGTPIWQVKATDPKQPYEGNQPITVDNAGNSYVPVSDGVGAYLESFDVSGNTRWISPQLHSCCETSLGTDGRVYVGGRANPSSAHIYGFDEATGAQTLDLATTDTIALYTYSGGIIQVGGNAVQYYSYAGAQLANVIGGSPIDSYEGYSASAGGDGLVFLAGYSSLSQFACSTPSVEAITAAGIRWNWTGPVGFGCGTHIAATPDGGVVLTTQTGSAYVSISAEGTTRWTYTPTAPHNGTVTLQPPITDIYGNVALPFGYSYSTPSSRQAHGLEVDFTTQNSVTTAQQRVIVEQSRCSNLFFEGYGAVDVGANQIYIGAVDQCPNFTFPALQAYAEPALGPNFQLRTPGTGTNIVPADSPTWAGYVLEPVSDSPISAQILVPMIQGQCTSVQKSAFWVGLNGFKENTLFLPQIGLDADCDTMQSSETVCGQQRTSASYYLWWEVNPHVAATYICSLPIVPGDSIDLEVMPAGTDVYMSASVLHANGRTSPTWTKRVKARSTEYHSAECIAEDPLSPPDSAPYPLTNFGSAYFNGCSAITDTSSRASLYAVTMTRPGTAGGIKASVGSPTFDSNGWNHFVVATAP